MNRHAESTPASEAAPAEPKPRRLNPQRRLPYTLAGVGEKTLRKLVDAGFATRESLAAATVEDISRVPGIGEKTAEKILAAARGEQTEGSADL